MFESENQIERDLMKATVDPAARPAFTRALLDAEVFVVLIPEPGTVLPNIDGVATLPEGMKLTLAASSRDGQPVIPFFTAPSRARAWFQGDHVVAPDKARNFFAGYPDTAFVLNPGSDYGKEFTPAEIRGMLEGKIEGEVVIAENTNIMLGHPKERPEELIAALAKELGAVKTVRGAWLMLAMIEGQADQNWMLGVDHDGDWANVQSAISRAAADGVLQGKMLDVLPLENNSLAQTLRTGIQIVPV